MEDEYLSKKSFFEKTPKKKRQKKKLKKKKRNVSFFVFDFDFDELFFVFKLFWF